MREIIMSTHPLAESCEFDDTDLVPFDESDKELALVEPVKVDSYDEKDESLDVEFDTIYNEALRSYRNISDDMVFVEGKFKARIGEVSNQFLGTALNAAKEKAALKRHKDTIVVKEAAGQVTNNNLVVGSHEELLRILKDAQKIKQVDVDG